MHYRIKLDRLGRPTSMPLGKASSDPCSRTLILNDAAELARRNKWITSQAIGVLDETLALEVLDQWVKLRPKEEAARAASVLRGHKKWWERDLDCAGLKGLYALARSRLTPHEIALVEAGEFRIQAKRQARLRLRGPAIPRDPDQRNLGGGLCQSV